MKMISKLGWAGSLENLKLSDPQIPPTFLDKKIQRLVFFQHVMEFCVGFLDETRVIVFPVFFWNTFHQESFGKLRADRAVFSLKVFPKNTGQPSQQLYFRQYTLEIWSKKRWGFGKRDSFWTFPHSFGVQVQEFRCRSLEYWVLESLGRGITPNLKTPSRSFSSNRHDKFLQLVLEHRPPVA